MGRESTAIKWFRLFLLLCILFLLGLSYWSSTLVEGDLKQVQKELGEVKGILVETQQKQEEKQKTILESLRRIDQPITHSSKKEKTISHPHMDSSFPNLLEEDLFFDKTLPEMLGNDFEPRGSLQEDLVFKPDTLQPFAGNADVSDWVSLCSLSVARSKFGIYETLAPYMAIKMEARPSKDEGNPEFWVHLREGVFWQPLDPIHYPGVKLAPIFLKKTPVTSKDFKFFYDAIMNPHVQELGAIAYRILYRDIKEIELIDDHTFVVRWKSYPVKQEDGSIKQKIRYDAALLTGGLRPLSMLVYTLFSDGSKILEEETPDIYRTSSIWGQNFSNHWSKNSIVSCGPWIFDGFNDRQISFKRNPDHFFPYDALVSRRDYFFKNTIENSWQDFRLGKTNLYYMIPSQLIDYENFLKSPAYQKQKEEREGIKKLSFLYRMFAYVGWNEARPLFENKRVRQALTMAIDRKRIIRQNLNGMGMETTGTFFPYSPAYDSSIAPWPFDPSQARRVLEEEGWSDQDGDGILEKEMAGKRVPFRFSLLFYVKNPLTKSICEYIATALKEIGIECELNGVDVADLSSSLDDKNFDAYVMAWALGTPPDNPRQIWHSEGAKEKGSSNIIGFVNPEVDRIIEALEFESDPNKRKALYYRFDAIIHEEAPYTFLYVMKRNLLYRDYVKNVFIPADRQDLVPGANQGEPDSSIFWIKSLFSNSSGLWTDVKALADDKS